MPTASQIYKDVYTFLSSDADIKQKSDVGITYTPESTPVSSIFKGFIGVSLVRDMATGLYITNKPTFAEIQLAIYHNEFSAIASPTGLDQLVLNKMDAFSPIGVNASHIIRHFGCRWIAEIGLNYSCQVYRFYTDKTV